MDSVSNTAKEQPFYNTLLIQGLNYHQYPILYCLNTQDLLNQLSPGINCFQDIPSLEQSLSNLLF